MLSTPEETLESIFNQAAGHSAAVERVKKIKDYAFVHFYHRDDALRALNVINSMSGSPSVSLCLSQSFDCYQNLLLLKVPCRR